MKFLVLATFFFSTVTSCNVTNVLYNKRNISECIFDTFGNLNCNVTSSHLCTDKLVYLNVPGCKKNRVLHCGHQICHKTKTVHIAHTQTETCTETMLKTTLVPVTMISRITDRGITISDCTTTTQVRNCTFINTVTNTVTDTITNTVTDTFTTTVCTTERNIIIDTPTPTCTTCPTTTTTDREITLTITPTPTCTTCPTTITTDREITLIPPTSSEMECPPGERDITLTSTPTPIETTTIFQNTTTSTTYSTDTGICETISITTTLNTTITTTATQLNNTSSSTSLNTSSSTSLNTSSTSPPEVTLSFV